jgi:hypothetical protein
VCLTKHLEPETGSHAPVRCSLLIAASKLFSSDSIVELHQHLQSVQVLEQFQFDKVFWLLAGKISI